MFHVDVVTQGDLSEYDLEEIKNLVEDTLINLKKIVPNEATEVTVTLTDNKGISELNEKWREQEGATDVLSFPALFAENEEEWTFADGLEATKEVYGEDVVGVCFEDFSEVEKQEEEGIDSGEEDDYDDNESEEGDEFPQALGDIVISLEFANYVVENKLHVERIKATVDEGKEDHLFDSTDCQRIFSMLEEWTLNDEIVFLLIHSYLHLLGYDHELEDDDFNMRHKELSVWLKLNHM